MLRSCTSHCCTKTVGMGCRGNRGGHHDTSAGTVLWGTPRRHTIAECPSPENALRVRTVAVISAYRRVARGGQNYDGSHVPTGMPAQQTERTQFWFAGVAVSVGLCTCFGLWRGGGSWAHDPGPKSDPKVWATRGVPHYGVRPLLSTLVGPFFDPGMPAHGVPSLGGVVSRFNPVHCGAPELMHS